MLTRRDWFHEILSFVILLCNTGVLSASKTTIYKNKSGVYCTDFGNGEVRFGSADNLYSAFAWFHDHIEKYGEAFVEAYDRNNATTAFAHVYTSNNVSLKRTALLEMPRVCLMRHRFPLSPKDFYSMLLKAHAIYRPDLFLLDLDTDIENHRRAQCNQ